MAESECSHCHRAIPDTVFSLHSVHCERFLYLCPLCAELIPKVSRLAHDAERHRTAVCEYCEERLEENIIKDHMKRCDLRPRPCVHCGCVLLFDELIEHEEVCGARTEQCEWCLKHVQIREMAHHLATCDSHW